MLSERWKRHFEQAHAEREKAGLQRELQVTSGSGRVRIVYKGKVCLSFASNDYLGLATHPRVTQAAIAAITDDGVGSSASPLITGTRELHERICRSISDFRGMESAVIFTTGYQANLGTFSALADKDTVVVSDELNHASIVDGCRLSRARVAVFPHRDYAAAERLVKDAGSARVVLASDTLFSIDGDMADCPRLLEIARRYDALLVLDDAHSFGALGDTGRGVLELQGVREADIDVVLGTFSKALGSLGGFACCSLAVRDYLINTARAFIFSTAGTTAQLGASLAALEVLREEGQERRIQMLKTATALRSGLQRAGFDTGGEAQIVPLWLGTEDKAVWLSQELAERKFLVPAIRPPTVPKGRSMLRFSVSANHTADHVDGVLAALKSLRDRI